MKRSRRTPSRSTKRAAHADPAQEDLAQEALAQKDSAVPPLDSPQPAAAASSDDQLRAAMDLHTPRSLQSGAGRQHWDEVLRLLVQIRADCDAAAARLGYASIKDGGLAAVEYIANKILEAVRGERQQHIASAKKPSAKQQAAARPPEVQSPTAARHQSDNRHKSDKRAQPAQPAAHSERSKLIGELKQMLRDGTTKAGVVIDPQLAHEIAKHITILNEAMAQPETPDALKQIRASLARFFGKVSGDGKKPSQAAAAAQRPKQAKTEPSGARKTMTKRSVTKRSKRSKRRSP